MRSGPVHKNIGHVTCVYIIHIIGSSILCNLMYNCIIIALLVDGGDPMYNPFSPNRNCWGSQFILQRVDGQDDLGT